MAISKKGNDGFTGKLGNTVTYVRKGQVVKRIIGEITAEPTIKQLANRQKTTITTALLVPVKAFIRIGFDLDVKGTTMSAYNRASSINRLNAITGIYPQQEVDFGKVILSKGKIPAADQIKVTINDIGLSFTWDPSLLLDKMRLSDRIMIVAYCPEKKAAYTHPDGAKRKEGAEEMSLPRYRGKVLLHIYVSFIASDRKSISTSEYLGALLW